MNAKIIALIPAAGTGTRLGDSLPKQYLDINGQPLIVHTLQALARVSRIEKIIVVLSPEDQHWRGLVANGSPAWTTLATRVETTNVGGKSRRDSVLNGLNAMPDGENKNTWIMVHDAARPCIRSELVEQFIDELENDLVGGLLALPLSDTIKLDDGNLRVAKTLPREKIWRAQTPQMFKFDLLQKALTASPNATDEAEAIEATGHQPKLVMGDSANLKVTYATDLKLAKMLLSEEK
jgi:2-C-methyl-D-erythritol 4-phosphate cytidylyltransferase